MSKKTALLFIISIALFLITIFSINFLIMRQQKEFTDSGPKLIEKKQGPQNNIGGIPVKENNIALPREEEPEMESSTPIKGPLLN